jgi:hypothetical protein
MGMNLPLRNFLGTARSVPDHQGRLSTWVSAHNLISDVAPEPGTWLVLAAGLSGFGLIKRYRRN